MTINYYKNELSSLDKEHFPEVEEWLGMATLDSDISVYELAELNNMADKIYYNQE